MTSEQIQEQIQTLISNLKNEKASREMSLVLTKLEEAFLWAGQIKN
jgi:hypothetical protein